MERRRRGLCKREQCSVRDSTAPQLCLINDEEIIYFLKETLDC